MNPLSTAYANMKRSWNAPTYNPYAEAIYGRAMDTPTSGNIGGEALKSLLGAIIGSKLGQAKMGYIESERKQRLADERNMLDYRAKIGREDLDYQMGLKKKQEQETMDRAYQSYLGTTRPESYSPTGEQWASPAPVAGVPQGMLPEIYNKLTETQLAKQGLLSKPTDLPAGLNEFEAVSGMKPNKRGTGEYRKTYMEFLKEKDKATTRPPTPVDTTDKKDKTYSRILTQSSNDAWRRTQAKFPKSGMSFNFTTGEMNTGGGGDPAALDFYEQERNKAVTARLKKVGLHGEYGDLHTQTPTETRKFKDPTKVDGTTFYKDISAHGSVSKGKKYLMDTYGYTEDQAERIIKEGMQKEWIK